MTKRAKPDAQEREILTNYKCQLKGVEAEKDARTRIYTRVRDFTSYHIDMKHEKIALLMREIVEYTASGYKNVNELGDAKYIHGPYSEDHHKRLWMVISCLPTELLRNCSERKAKQLNRDPFMWKAWLSKSGKYIYLPATIFSLIFHFTAHCKFEASKVAEN